MAERPHGAYARLRRRRRVVFARRSRRAVGRRPAHGTWPRLLLSMLSEKKGVSPWPLPYPSSPSPMGPSPSFMSTITVDIVLLNITHNQNNDTVPDCGHTTDVTAMLRARTCFRRATRLGVNCSQVNKTAVEQHAGGRMTHSGATVEYYLQTATS